MYADGDWKLVEEVLRKDMTTADEYLQTWKLKLSAKQRCRQSSTSTTRKLNVSQKSITTGAGLFGLAVLFTGHFAPGRFGLGHFGHDFYVHKQLISLHLFIEMIM